MYCNIAEIHDFPLRKPICDGDRNLKKKGFFSPCHFVTRFRGFAAHRDHVKPKKKPLWYPGDFSTRFDSIYSPPQLEEITRNTRDNHIYFCTILCGGDELHGLDLVKFHDPPVVTTRINSTLVNSCNRDIQFQNRGLSPQGRKSTCSRLVTKSFR